MATLTHRLGLAGAWLRYPWWPLNGSGMNGTDVAGLLAALAPGAQAPVGLLVDVDAADQAGADGDWLDRLVTAAGSPATGFPAGGSLTGGSLAGGLSAGPRIALAGAPPAVARWRGLTRRPGTTAPWLALPAGTGADAGPADAIFVPCVPGRDLAGGVAAAASAAAGRPVLAEVTVSVGRTATEARARADADELFTLAGHPAE